MWFQFRFTEAILSTPINGDWAISKQKDDKKHNKTGKIRVKTTLRTVVKTTLKTAVKLLGN